MIGLYVRRFLSTELKILLLYFVLALVADFIAAYLSSQGINNLWVFHIFTIVEYGFLTIILSMWQKNAVLKRVLQLTVPVFTLLGIVAIAFLEDTTQFNNFSNPIAQLLLISASAITLFELHNEGPQSVFGDPRFWIGSGILVYNASTLVIFSLSNLLSMELLIVVFTFHTFMNFITNLTYAGAFLCRVPIKRFGGR